MESALIDIAGQWRANMTTDLTRYAVFSIGVWLVLWVALAPVLRGRKIRAERSRAVQLATEFLVSIRSIATFSTVGLATFLMARAGWLPGPGIAATWGPVWFWLSLVLMMIGHDAYFYWAHRLMHRPQLFRRFHRRHHLSHNPSPFTAYSFDLGEAAVMATFVPVWVMIVPTAWEAVGLFMLHQIVRNTLGHSGYEVMPAGRDGRPLFDWMTSVTHHDLHHAQAGYNYGLYFTWWDRWMGTEHPEYHARYAAAVRKPLLPRARSRKGAIAAGVVIAGLLVLPVTQARADSPASLAGDWATPGLGAVVRLAPCTARADALCGAMVWAWDPARMEAGAIGREMLTGFVWRDGAWRDGRLRNPEDGRTYQGSIRSDGAVLRLRGCAGPFCQDQVWRRLRDIPRP